MKRFKFLLLMLIAAPLLATASEEGVQLDKAPVDLADHQSLQRGARVFINQCLSCHSASYMRYSRLQDLGLSEQQIKDNLLFATDKVGSTMDVAMTKADAKAWLGATPPDLSVEARARGADWLYTYLRGFYRDDSRPTGWNNVVFDKVGMPHVLWTFQGVMKPVYREDGEHKVVDHLELEKPGSMTLAEYDGMTADLVNYMVWMSEPAKLERQRLGIFVLGFLGVFFIVAYYLKKEFWKDIH
jgi:ubiquinol-cytochrome c reductase cytochrome c1 subunit